jgi:hypothetical protein
VKRVSRYILPLSHLCFILCLVNKNSISGVCVHKWWLLPEPITRLKGIIVPSFCLSMYDFQLSEPAI